MRAVWVPQTCVSLLSAIFPSSFQSYLSIFLSRVNQMNLIMRDYLLIYLLIGGWIKHVLK